MQDDFRLGLGHSFKQRAEVAQVAAHVGNVAADLGKFEQAWFGAGIQREACDLSPELM
ncbi:hypothetical protein D3C81_1157910 [compost metagenome]